MDHDETERCEHENGNVGRVLVHPSLFRSVPAHAGEEPGDESLWMSPAGEALRRGHRQDAVVWYLGDEELFNGCITEIRLAAPAMWLQTRIEGLPEAPDACFHLADGSIVRVPLGEGATVRWPRGGVDRSLCSQVLDLPARSLQAEPAHVDHVPLERPVLSLPHLDPVRSQSQKIATKPK